MFARLLRLFKVESMIKPDLVQGELPTTKQAYKDVLQIALPSIMELVLISLINSMDTMMVVSAATRRLPQWDWSDSRECC